MTNQEEELHAYGVCEQCGGSLRFPLRGQGTSIACPHCDNPTILKLGTDPVRAQAVLPPTVQRPPDHKSPRRHLLTIFLTLSSVFLFLVGCLCVFAGCSGTIAISGKDAGAMHQIFYTLQYGFGWVVLALSLILYTLVATLRSRD